MEFVADGIRYGLGGSLDILDADIFAVVLATDDHVAAFGVVEGGDCLEILIRPGFLPFHIEVRWLDRKSVV